MLTKTEPSPDTLVKLAKARAALNGQSPRLIGAQKQRIALDWIYRWGWSSATILDLATGGGRTGLATRLVKNGLLAATKTESGGVKGAPNSLLTLTSKGLDEAERHCLDLIQYEIDPYRIDQSKLRHDGLAQRATANSLKSGNTKHFKTPKELAAKSDKETKQPDVIWITKDDKRIGIEIELSAKWERRLDQFVNSCMISMSTSAHETNQVDQIYLVSDSKAILTRYSAAFTAGSKFNRWTKNDRGFWMSTSISEVPTWVKERMLFKFIEY